MILEESFPPDNRVENEIKILNEIGYVVTVVCLQSKNQKKSEFFLEKNLIHRFQMPKWIYKSSIVFFQFPIYYWYWYFKIVPIIKRNHFTAVHIHDLRLARLGHFLKKRFELKFILDLHENYPDMLKESEHIKKFLAKIFFNYDRWKKYERQMVSSADLVITVVEEMKNRISKGLNYDTKICVYQNVPDLERFKLLELQNTVEIEKNEGEIILLYVGAINKPRGLDTIAEALMISNLANEKIKVYVVGDGSYKDSFQDYIKKLGLSKLFKFYGHQNMSTILKIMKLSDVGIIPHFRSPQNDCSSPNKLFQYMYAQLPVVVSNCISLERVVLENECGYVFEEKNAESLAHKLEEIILNPEIAKRKGILGHSSVINSFNTFNEGEYFKKAYFNLIK